MSEIKSITLSGEIMWAKLRDPEETPEGDAAFYSLNIECTDEQYQEMVDFGISKLTKLREMEDGKKFIKVKTPAWKTIDGAKREFKKPAVFDPSMQPINALIANGSKGVAVVELIKMPKSKFVKAKASLHSVCITELIEYQERDYSDVYRQALESQGVNHSLGESDGLPPELA